MYDTNFRSSLLMTTLPRYPSTTSLEQTCNSRVILPLCQNQVFAKRKKLLGGSQPTAPRGHQTTSIPTLLSRKTQFPPQGFKCMAQQQCKNSTLICSLGEFGHI